MAETGFAPATTGILCNTLSGRLRKRREAVRRVLNDFAPARIREACTADEVTAALHAFAAEGIDLLVVAGGDGTLQMVLSCLFADRPFTKLPVLAVIPGGTTNMTALDLGVRGGPVRVLRQLRRCLLDPASARLVRRAVVRVERGEAPDVYGMCFGAGVLASGVSYFQSRIRRLGITGEFASGLVVLRFLGELLVGRHGKIMRPVEIASIAGHGGMQGGTYLFVLASTLERLLLGARPYWGEQDEPMHVTCVKEGPHRFWRSLLPLLAGRGRKLREQDGYFSWNARVVDMAMADHFIVDGEVYIADSERPLHLSATGPAVFLVP
jgi:diacylglycerol kinase (ATP)